jgi:hypothetical protein
MGTVATLLPGRSYRALCQGKPHSLGTSAGYTAANRPNLPSAGKFIMPKYVIERTLPGAGKMSDKEMQQISAKSNDVVHGMAAEGTPIQWVESYVTGDKLYCVYNAPSEQAIREHATRGGFPADTVARVARIIDPTSGEARKTP